MAHRHVHLVVTLVTLLLLSTVAKAQDTLVAKKEHSAKKAAIMSAILPGAGQVYNGKWWKVPIIYAGFGGVGYLAYSNYYDYKTFLTAYKIKTGNLEESITPTDYEVALSQSYQASQLQSYKESYRRDFELYCIIMAAWYGLNIVDAIVDGHLYTYDIGDDLSFTVDPIFSIPSTPNLALAGGRQSGLTFSFNF